jgi:hypothetical protein
MQAAAENQLGSKSQLLGSGGKLEGKGGIKLSFNASES